MDHVVEDEEASIVVSDLDFSMAEVEVFVEVVEVWLVDLVASEVVYHSKALVVLEVVLAFFVEAVAAAFVVSAAAAVVYFLAEGVEEFHLQDCQSWSPRWDLKVFRAP